MEQLKTATFMTCPNIILLSTWDVLSLSMPPPCFMQVFMMMMMVMCYADLIFDCRKLLSTVASFTKSTHTDDHILANQKFRYSDFIILNLTAPLFQYLRKLIMKQTVHFIA